MKLLSILQRAILLIIASCGFGLAAKEATWSTPSTFSEWIDLAGNSDSDEQRYEMLVSLSKTNLTPKAEMENLASLLETIAQWNEGEDLAEFSKAIYREGEYEFGFGTESAFHPIAELYETRMWVWAILEYGNWWSLPEKRRELFDQVRPRLERLSARFPQNRILRMYLGEPYVSNRSFSPAPGFPAWAVYQREAIERQREMIHWWIDERMRENGEYGGGWGDDCEMWRRWMPLLVGFEDPKIVAAQERFSEALLSQPHMSGGFTSKMSDVEHTAEDTSDTITPMMLIKPEDRVWAKRSSRLADLMERLWSGTNERGFLQFKSTYFTAQDIDLEERKAVASVYEVRAIQPALLYWQRTGDPQLQRLFTAWLDGWIDASMRTERGKPAGIIPSAIHWPDGTVGGTGPNWWKPGNYSDNPLYVWPSAMHLMSQALVLGWHMTQSERYLEPIFAMAEVRLNWLKDPVPSPEPGSLAWCGKNMSGLIDGLVKYRFLSGDSRFDELIRNDAGPYIQYRLFGDSKTLETAIRDHSESLRINFPGYTSEVRYTDRITRFPQLFTEASMYDAPVAGIYEPDMQMLNSCLTGEPGTGLVFPLNAVRWRTQAKDFAALVTESSSSTFEAEICHFGTELRKLSVQLFLLEPGSYTILLYRLDRNDPSKEFQWKSEKPGDEAFVTLEPNAHYRLSISQ